MVQGVFPELANTITARFSPAALFIFSHKCQWALTTSMCDDEIALAHQQQKPWNIKAKKNKQTSSRSKKPGLFRTRPLGAGKGKGACWKTVSNNCFHTLLSSKLRGYYKPQRTEEPLNDENRWTRGELHNKWLEYNDIMAVPSSPQPSSKVGISVKAGNVFLRNPYLELARGQIRCCWGKKKAKTPYK